jgi:hypothetical protein
MVKRLEEHRPCIGCEGDIFHQRKGSVYIWSGKMPWGYMAASLPAGNGTESSVQATELRRGEIKAECTELICPGRLNLLSRALTILGSLADARPPPQCSVESI